MKENHPSVNIRGNRTHKQRWAFDPARLQRTITASDLEGILPRVQDDMDSVRRFRPRDGRAIARCRWRRM